MALGPDDFDVEVLVLCVAGKVEGAHGLIRIAIVEVLVVLPIIVYAHLARFCEILLHELFIEFLIIAQKN